MVQFETCMVIDDRGDRSRFVEDVYASRGQVGINPAGSGKTELHFKIREDLKREKTNPHSFYSFFSFTFSKSVHQSFSSKEGGAMLFVLWSGCHCNIKLSNVKHKLGTELLREV